ncbi:WD repeat-containing and planar cell polarity effector protein fritz homolog isoform X2 [Clinocottus analis]|uniref:WD repeat-containing and planar cell polarity effector protein fritz homolog isoform X2 n=1 Tax=Clinocottus analis TaxID=304258 RepID=UPI0035BF8E34
MAFCLAELHLWSTKSSLQVKDTDIGTYQYYDKGEPANPLEHHYYNEKLAFCEARGYSWTPKNRRPEKLRDSLKELEELLQTNTCVQSRWRSRHCCQVLLSGGVLVTLNLNGPQLHQVHVDRTLVNRLPANTVADAVLGDRLILLSFLEQSQVAAVYLQQKNQDSPESRRLEKLSPSDTKVVCVEASGRGRRLLRRVRLNRLQDVALCWWDLDEPGDEPWTPTDTHRNNLVLLSCSAAEGLKVLGSLRSEGNPLDCVFSVLQPHQLLTVELPMPAAAPGLGGGSWADACVYECARGLPRRLSVARIPLPSRAVSCARHPSETALLLGLADSSLVLYDRRRGASLLALCPVPPALLAWHPAGAVVMAGGEQGELMCFDAGLAPVGVALVAEEEAAAAATPTATLRLSEHLRCSGGLEAMRWAAGLEGDVLMLGFHGGPLAALRLRLGALTGGQLGPGELLQQRLRCGQVKEALGVLEAMDWCIMGDECYRGLSAVTNHLLRLQLTAEREAQLEAALGVFYAPPAPLSDAVILEYREPISKCARRFFHHLLRHQRLEKAFLLAVDLGARDLFMDLHYVAGDKGELVLADVAERKANEIQAQTAEGRRAVLFGSGLGDEPAERNQSASGPPYPESPTTHADGRANQRREPDHVTASRDVLRTLRPTGSAAADGNDDEDLEMLQVVHLGMF